MKQFQISPDGNNGWRKASISVNNGACAEVAAGPNVVAVRDSVDPEGPIVHVPTQAMRDFISRVTRGEFDRADVM